jgi:hypothetical protein
MSRFHVAVVWLVIAVSLAGCAAPTPSTPTPVGPSAIQVAVASNDFAVGQPRLPIVLFSGPERVTDAQRVVLTPFDLSSGTPTPGGWSGEAINFSDYEVPYWVAYPELPHAGYWGFVAEITLADGSTTEAQFTIEALGQGRAPGVGSQPPASDNRTLSTEPDITKLTSDPEPEPGLYQLTVADALKTGKPTVVTFATPAFCESRLCAPVVNSVKAVYGEWKEEANFIHIEVYKSFNPLVYADEMEEWGLPSEPWTFVLDQTGKVVAQLGGPVSPRELTTVLAPLMAP